MANLTSTFAIINQRALILGLALLFSDFDTILPSAASAHLGLGAQSAQSTATHEAADGHIIDNTAPLRLDWAPPPPQGQTLRERVERRERQVRLRCCARRAALAHPTTTRLPTHAAPFGCSL
ncbi:hypothetical protein B0H14DRAFT_3479813 [Mycena olivaceomarginata]|nr:hypothetical protein B0H14DRAFT_3479813 [Mycena olivaceomarginata]